MELCSVQHHDPFAMPIATQRSYARSMELCSVPHHVPFAMLKATQRSYVVRGEELVQNSPRIGLPSMMGCGRPPMS